MKYIIILALVALTSCGHLVKPSVDKECDFNDYDHSAFSLKQNGSGKWAIKSYSGILGYSTRYGQYGFYEFDSYETMTFSDSCSAKGLLKKYLENLKNNSF